MPLLRYHFVQDDRVGQKAKFLLNMLLILFEKRYNKRMDKQTREHILAKLSTLPMTSGVYIMKNNVGEVIYVGKAKRLRNRVKSYFDNSPKTKKTYALVANIVDFDYILTPSESNAFSLEANLIKQYSPQYNILLKDDKAFPFLKLTIKEKYPRLIVERRPKNDGNLLFGPFVTGVPINSLVAVIRKAFKLRTCNKDFSKAKPQKPCLHGDLGECLPVCTGNVSEEEYDKEVQSVIRFLNGDNSEVIRALTQKMNGFAESGKFEEAIIYRDQIRMLEKANEEIITTLNRDISIDIFTIYQTEDIGAINVMIIRGGRIISQINYPITAQVGDDQTILSSFLTSYYENASQVPSEIELSQEIESSELLQSFLQEKFGKKVHILVPQKGVKKSLVEASKRNAEEYSLHSLDRMERDKRLTTDALKELAELLNVDKVYRIEGYDISNISGTNNVASMVVFEGGVPCKKEYRKFKIKTVNGANDFACMNETLDRRISDMISGKENFEKKPDVLLIDGGLGQLHAANKILEKYNVQIPLISLAKRDEEIYTLSSPVPTSLPRTSNALKLLQRVRDESHRFAVLYHRNVRNKKEVTSLFDSVAGLGKKRQTSLWRQFKTLDNLYAATPYDIANIPGIGEKTAIELYNKLHENDKDMQ